MFVWVEFFSQKILVTKDTTQVENHFLARIETLRVSRSRIVAKRLSPKRQPQRPSTYGNQPPELEA